MHTPTTQICAKYSTVSRAFILVSHNIRVHHIIRLYHVSSPGRCVLSRPTIIQACTDDHPVRSTSNLHCCPLLPACCRVSSLLGQVPSRRGPVERTCHMIVFFFCGRNGISPSVFHQTVAMSFRLWRADQVKLVSTPSFSSPDKILTPSPTQAFQKIMCQ